jgi:hypothetical protein
MIASAYALRATSYGPDTVALPNFGTKTQALKVSIMAVLSIMAYKCY